MSETMNINAILKDVIKGQLKLKLKINREIIGRMSLIGWLSRKKKRRFESISQKSSEERRK